MVLQTNYNTIAGQVDSNSHQDRTSCAIYSKMGMLTRTSCSYEARLVISHFAAAANLPCLTGSPAPGQGPQFLRSAYPHLGAAVAPLQGLCPQVKSCAAHRFCFVVSVLVAFLHSSAIDWRTSDWNVGFCCCSFRQFRLPVAGGGRCQWSAYGHRRPSPWLELRRKLGSAYTPQQSWPACFSRDS